MRRTDSEPPLRADELFAAALLGYTFDEVDTYVQDTATRMRRLIAEVQRLSAANILLDEARDEIAKLTAELGDARPHATIGPRVQSIMRLAEQEADELRVTACEVLAEARRDADAIRRQAQHDADKARRDYELALDKRRRDERRQQQEHEACRLPGRRADARTQSHQAQGQTDGYLGGRLRRRSGQRQREPTGGPARRGVLRRASGCVRCQEPTAGALQP